MRIVALDTIRIATHSNILLLRLHCDTGDVGLGEAFYGAGAVEDYLHATVAPALFALDATPESVATVLPPYCGYASGGAEVRGNGAVDIALWDLLARAAGLPLVRLLGGPVREHVRIYNTCAGAQYVSRSTRQRSDNWGLPAGDRDPYQDLQAFLTHPGKLARNLLDEGITAMKVWPFDLGAERTGGIDIADSDLDAGIRVIAAIREETGDAMDIMVELHGLWSPRAARRICAALEPYRPFWVEDPLRPDLVDALADLRNHTAVPIATGETLTGRRAFLRLLQDRAVDVVTVDVGWTGGLTEARKVAVLADTYGIPIAPHDCTGPVSLAVAAALCLSQPNGLIQETTRAFLPSWYADITEGLPDIDVGVLRLGERPGHGVTLAADLIGSPGVTMRSSSRETLR